MLKKLFHEPLLHFMLIGAAFFLVYELQDNAVPEDDMNRIVINQAQIERLNALWQKQRQRPPTQQELDGLIEYQIREEVLYREALAMGLDKNDAGVRRRLAQKVNFIFSDIADQAEPTEADLAEYLQSNHKEFETPGSVSFEHIYFNTDKRGNQAAPDARALLKQLVKTSANVDTQLAGDRSLLGYQYEQLADDEVAKMFGKHFSELLFQQPVGNWQGPLTSSYGVHLVRIKHITPASLPQLDTVRDKVHTAWLAEQRDKMNADFYQRLRQQYEIVVEREAGATQ